MANGAVESLLSRLSQYSQLLTGLAVGLSIAGLAYAVKGRKKNERKTLLDCIGKTPLIYLPRLSQALNSEIYVSIKIFR